MTCSAPKDKNSQPWHRYSVSSYTNLHTSTQVNGISKCQPVSASLEMLFDIVLAFEISATWTAKLLIVRVDWHMLCQFTCCIETLWTITATYGFTSSWRHKCILRFPFWLNFFWQMWHVNQVPSLCDFSRCALRWWCCLKQSEQCLHEYGFVPVWV